MKLTQFSKYDLDNEKLINKKILGYHYMKADENGYFVIYTPDGSECCWKILEVDMLTSNDWEIVKEPGF